MFLRPIEGAGPNPVVDYMRCAVVSSCTHDVLNGYVAVEVEHCCRLFHVLVRRGVPPHVILALFRFYACSSSHVL